MLDFVRIFAKTGANINISTFGINVNGNVAENAITGAPWAEAQKLRAENPNVGITFVATDDTLLEWALAQDWIDVVIPFHLVRTGKALAMQLGYENYTGVSADKKAKDFKKEEDLRSIPPTVHNNDFETYMQALEENHLKPRFQKWIHNPNYMKLVNECRQSASQSRPVQPIFDQEAAEASLFSLIGQGGYYNTIGGSVDRMYEIAGDIADKINNGDAAEAARQGREEWDQNHPRTKKAPGQGCSTRSAKVTPKVSRTNSLGHIMITSWTEST